VTELTHSNNFYVFNNGDYNVWPLNHAVLTFAAEVSELMPGLISGENLFGRPAGDNTGPRCRVRPVAFATGAGIGPAVARWWSEDGEDGALV